MSHHWKQARMPAYRTLGSMIALLEALDRGEEIPPKDKAPGSQGEAVSPTERYICLKGACRLLLASIQRSIEAVLSRSVGRGEDVVIFECRLQTGEEAANELLRMN